jgi:hypothetical protein
VIGAGGLASGFSSGMAGIQSAASGLAAVAAAAAAASNNSTYYASLGKFLPCLIQITGELP